eukprot:TRINITY_DN38053_c0_g1_i1.p1 TRINITY_DN38053_c0_g1~~TRINITY_DN38053_c0_g1_i1.p1  ORF type:complete len:118 (+),score=8.70 TRINITY_DN38053_c0_g1_i1:23-355(+)
MGKYKEALKYHKEALDRWQGGSDGQRLVAGLSSVGTCYIAIGEHENAREYFMRSVEEMQKLRRVNLRDVEGVFKCLKVTLSAINEHEEAHKYALASTLAQILANSFNVAR